MMGRTEFLIKTVLALAVLWGSIYGIMAVAGVFRVTPEKIGEFIDERPFSEIDDPVERQERLYDLAEQINRLDYEERRQFREDEERKEGRRDFFEELNGEEKLYFLDLTLGSGFKQMMKAFNEMDEGNRQRIIDRAVRQISKQESRKSEGRVKKLEEEDEEIYEKIVAEGMRSYFTDASAATKRDLAPLMEEMQRQMKMR